MQNSCTYTGTIQTARQRSTPMRARPSGRPSLAASDLVSFDHDDIQEPNLSIATPSTVRRKKRGRDPRSDTKRSGSTRKRYVPAAERHVLDEDWYREPPPRLETLHDLEPEKSEAELSRQKVLGAYTDIVIHLPIEIYRSTTFIKTLDRSYITKTRQLDTLCRQLRDSTDLAKSLEYRGEIVRLMAESKQDRAEAVAEATKLQQLIGSHITLLSSDLDKLENPQSEMPLFDQDFPSAASSHKKGRKKTSKSANEDADMDIPIDDGEPIYCICNRVSFGQMIACENSNCQHGEWFHFDCLHLTSTPRGKWWCPECTSQGLASTRFTEEAAAANTGASGTRKVGESREEKRKRVKAENRRREAERRQKLRRQ